MKNALYFLTLTLLFSVSIGSASAAVFRVNNSLTENIPGGLFTALQRAHDHFSVKNGDTLMVEGSTKSYDGFTCTKRLVIIGPGYFLGENSGVNGMVTSALINDYINFKDGSQGSYVVGVETGYTLYIRTASIYLIRCKILNLGFAGAANSKVVSSFINTVDGTYSYLNDANIAITNSIIERDYSKLSYLTYENNILVGNYEWAISAGTFRNNILLSRDAKVEIKSPTIQNNLAPNAQFGTTNGNTAYEPANVFVGTGSSDGKYRIKANSPYIAAGYNGTQPGIFGGSEPYTLSGVPPIPIIYELNVPGTGSAASGLNINVKIRGAN